MIYSEFLAKLTPIYGKKEAKAILFMVLQERFYLSPADVYCGKISELSEEDKAYLNEIVKRLEHNEPVQYILGNVSWGELNLKVNYNTLIPRPETEELCNLVFENLQDNMNILDIGTGTGCIAIWLALKNKQCNVTAWDISDETLNIAKQNAKSNKAQVNFVKQDALKAPKDTEKWNIIVSNPPYICEKEKANMHANVLNFEPKTALFVPDEDPLLFYKAISLYAKQALKNGGRLFFEINSAYGNETQQMLLDFGFNDIEVEKDMFGNVRFVKAVKI